MIAVKGHDDTFIINDIELSVPPTAISINKQAYNATFETLRTKTTQKTKSGRSEVQITFQVPFVGITDINKKLRPLLAQLRLTPFCWVENKYIRDNMLPPSVPGSKTSSNMALTLRGLTLQMHAGDPDTVFAHFDFLWFNYRPYSSNFEYKTNFLPTENTLVGKALRPADSQAWRDFYEAPMTERHPIIPVKGLDKGIDFKFFKFGLGPKSIQEKQKLNELHRLFEELDINPTAVPQFINGMQTAFETGEVRTIGKLINKQLANEDSDYVFPSTGPTADLLKDFIKTANLDSAGLDYEITRRKARDILDLIKTAQTKIREQGIYGDDWKLMTGAGIEITDQTQLGVEYGLWRRDIEVPLIPTNGTVVETITVELRNKIAVLPMSGHFYATHQHIGSFDASVSVGLKVTSDEAMQRLQASYDAIEGTALRARHIPQRLQYIELQNNLIQLMGLRRCLTKELQSRTIEGQPGTYAVNLSFTESSIDEQYREDIVQEYIRSESSVRTAIIQRLAKSIEIIDDVQRFQVGSEKEETLFSVSNRMRFDNKAVQKQEQEQYSKFVSQVTEFLNKYIVNTQGNTTPIVDRIVKDSHLLTFAQSITDSEILGIVFVKQALVERKAPILNSEIFKKDQEKFRLLNERIQVAESLGFRLPQDVLKIAGGKKGLLSPANIPGTLTIEQKQKLLSAKAEEARSALTEIYGSDVPGRLVRLLQPMVDEMVRIADLIITSGAISLKEFDRVRTEFLPKIGGLQPGRPAYGDYPHLAKLITNESIITQALISPVGSDKVKPTPVLLDPDFYFIDEMLDLGDFSSGEAHTLPAKSAALRTANNLVGENGFLNRAESWLKNEVIPVLANVKRTEDVRGKPVKTLKAKMAKNLEQGKLKTQQFGKATMTMDTEIIESISNSSNSKDILDTHYSLKVQVDGATRFRTNLKKSLQPQSNQLYHSTKVDKIFDGDPRNGHRGRKPKLLFDIPVTPWTPDERGFSRDPVPHPRSFSTEVDADGNEKKKPLQAAHLGMDLVTTWGQPVRATGDGIISRVGWQEGAFDKDSGLRKDVGAGFRVEIRHVNSHPPPLSPEVEQQQKKRLASLPVWAAAAVASPTGKYNGILSQYFHLEPSYYANANEANVGQPNIPVGALQPGQFLDSEDMPRLYQKVRQGDIIGYVGSTGNSTGAHLHFGIIKNGRHENPLAFLFPPANIDGPPEVEAGSVFDLSFEQLLNEIRLHQGRRMVRAYPTFKLYFIEEDQFDKRYQFDDFFSYSAVQSIEVVRDRNVPADLCRIVLTNISGKLSNRRWSNYGSANEANYGSTDAIKDKKGNDQAQKTAESDQNIANENPIASMMLREGTVIQLRLGYANDPDRLETVFNGRITTVSPLGGDAAGTDDLIEIVCQSFAMELVQNVKATEKPKTSDGFFISEARTNRLLTEMISEPEVQHFGRWEKDPTYVSKNRQLLVDTKGMLGTGIFKNKVIADDNIFAPDSSDLDGDLFSNLKYVMYRTTIWEVFKEMELRHPGWRASAVPYEGTFGPRMTMFFGLPDQLYFARDQFPDEVRAEKLLLDAVNESNITEIENTLARQLKDPTNQVAPSLARDVQRTQVAEGIIRLKNKEIQTFHAAKKTIKALSPKHSASFQTYLNGHKSRLREFLAMRVGGKKGPQIRPFRSYHLLTSDNHIISNSIAASRTNVFNTVTVQYSGGEFDNDLLQFVYDDTDAAVTLKADALIPDERVQELYAQYPSCTTEKLGHRYALGLLMQSLRNIYKGEITILGNPAVKPLDVCYIMDEYNDMIGAVEVERVVHVFSQATGFVTAIKPDMIVHSNELSTMLTKDAMSVTAESLTRQMKGLKTIGLDTGQTSPGSLFSTAGAIGSATVAAATATLGPVGLTLGIAATWVGLFAAKKAVQYTNYNHPVAYSPLLYHGRPMIAGVAADRIIKTWNTRLGQFRDEGLEGIGQWWDKTWGDNTSDAWENMGQEKKEK